MIVSTGIDIVEVYRISQSMKRTPRFTERVFTAAERAYCEGKGVMSGQSYAARFAAKEAFLKALKTGWSGKITWHDVEVVIDPDGAPSLVVTGAAADILNEQGAHLIHLSLSHTADHAVAYVILEKR